MGPKEGARFFEELSLWMEPPPAAAAEGRAAAAGRRRRGPEIGPPSSSSSSSAKLRREGLGLGAGVGLGFDAGVRVWDLGFAVVVEGVLSSSAVSSAPIRRRKFFDRLLLIWSNPNLIDFDLRGGKRKRKRKSNFARDPKKTSCFVLIIEYRILHYRFRSESG